MHALLGVLQNARTLHMQWAGTAEAGNGAPPRPGETADGRYIACLTDDLYIDGADAAKSNVARWMNHASAAKANVAWRKQTIGPRKAMRFYATRAISPGEELCFDYDASGSYWEALGETPLD